MIEIQCTSCLTRYRIEPSVLPAEKPTFKCSRCGHVFSADPRRARNVAASAPPVFKRTATEPPPKPQASQPPPPPPVAESKPAVAPKPAPEPRPITEPKPAPAAASTVPPTPPKPAPIAPAAEAKTPKAPPSSETHNPLARSFGDHDDAKPGENLSFDFAEDFGPASEPVEPPSEPVKETRWQVGSFDPPMQDDFAHGPNEMADAADQARDTSDLHPQYSDPRTRVVNYPPADAERAGERIRSSGFFLMVFFLLLASFTAISVLISNQAAASLAVLSHMPGLADYFARPAPQVALHETHAEYQRLKDGHAALMISGSAENLGQSPLHAVQIEIDLLDPSRRVVVRQAVYCGNQISLRMIADMTPRELEFFGKLDPPRNFVVSPGGSSSFVAIFIDPPAQSHSFRIAVADARAPESAPHS